MKTCIKISPNGSIKLIELSFNQSGFVCPICKLQLIKTNLSLEITDHSYIGYTCQSCLPTQISLNSQYPFSDKYQNTIYFIKSIK